MHRSLLLAVALFILPLAAHADEASKRAKAEEMLTITKVDNAAQQMLASVPVRVKTLASQQPAVQAATSPEQKKLASDYVAQMQTIATNGAKWETVHPQIVDLYVNAFTEAELDSIIAFYKTPAGQTLLAKTPELSTKTIQLLQGSLAGLEPQLQAATKAFQTEIQRTSPGGGAPTPSTPAKPPTLGPPAKQ